MLFWFIFPECIPVPYIFILSLSICQFYPWYLLCSFFMVYFISACRVSYHAGRGVIFKWLNNLGFHRSFHASLFSQFVGYLIPFNSWWVCRYSIEMYTHVLCRAPVCCSFAPALRNVILKVLPCLCPAIIRTACPGRGEVSAAFFSMIYIVDRLWIEERLDLI